MYLFKKKLLKDFSSVCVCSYRRTLPIAKTALELILPHFKNPKLSLYNNTQYALLKM